MKKFLIGFVIVVVGMALGVGASFGAAILVSKVAGQRLAAGTTPAQSFRLNKDGTNKMGPGMRRNGMPGWQQGQPGMGPGFRNRAPFGGQNGPNWGQGGRGMPGPCWNGNQNDRNGQNNQNGQNGGCLNMGPGKRGTAPNGSGWPRR